MLSRRGGLGGGCGQRAGELSARGDVELAVHAAEVHLDRLDGGSRSPSSTRGPATLSSARSRGVPRSTRSTTPTPTPPGVSEALPHSPSRWPPDPNQRFQRPEIPSSSVQDSQQPRSPHLQAASPQPADPSAHRRSTPAGRETGRSPQAMDGQRVTGTQRRLSATSSAELLAVTPVPRPQPPFSHHEHAERRRAQPKQQSRGQNAPAVIHAGVRDQTVTSSCREVNASHQPTLTKIPGQEPRPVVLHRCPRQRRPKLRRARAQGLVGGGHEGRCCSDGGHRRPRPDLDHLDRERA